MKLYRAIDFKEFTDLLLGKTITGNLQENGACHYFHLEMQKFVTAEECPDSFICTYTEDIFYHDFGRNVFLLELEIPTESLYSYGYGIYHTGLYNPFIKDYHDGYYINNPFGLPYEFSRGVGSYIKEIYISSYSFEHVRSIQLIYQEKECTSLGLNTEYLELQFHPEYIYLNLIHQLQDVFKKQGLSYTSLYENHVMWTYPISLNTLKRCLLQELVQNLSGLSLEIASTLIKKMCFYQGNKMLERGIYKNTIKTKFHSELRTSSLFYTLHEVFENPKLYHFENLCVLPEVLPKPVEQELEFLNEYVKLEGLEDSPNWDWDIAKQFTYTLLHYANLI